jgi:hypothetical protein
MRFNTTASAIGFTFALACAGCAAPSEPTETDVLQQLTANGTATFALAMLDDPLDQYDQRGSVLARDDIACDAAGNTMRTFETDTVVLYRDGRAERIYRSETPDADHGQGLNFRGVMTGTWQPFVAPPNWFHYSEGPSIVLSLTLAPGTTPGDLHFRVLSATEISTVTHVGPVHCPSNPNPGHSVRHSAFLRYERL